MDQPCPTCGNRRNTPGADTCTICGEPLSRVNKQTHSEHLLSNAPGLRASYDQNLPIPLNPGLVDQNGRTYTINPETDNVIGSLTSADISIQGPDVQLRHARIYSSNGQIFLEAVIGCLVLVNGRAVVREARLLRDHDMIKFGSNTFMRYQINMTANQPLTTLHANTNDELVRVRNSRTQVSQTAPVNCDLYGRVRHVDGPYYEDPDPSLGRSLSKAAGFVLALWRPAFLMFQKPNQQVPVRYLRIETSSGQERMVKMKGNLVTGALHVGDTALFWGEWRDGTLLMHRGHNESIQTAVLLSQ